MSARTLGARCATVLCALGIHVPSALAACPTIPAPVLAPGAETMAIEGPLLAFDLPGRTVTVAGTCIDVPLDVRIDTSGDGVGDLELDQLFAGGLVSPLGGTMILDVAVTEDALGALRFTASTPFFEFGEHVVVGPLVSVDPGGGIFIVGGTTVVMNTDPRIPSQLLDLGGQPAQLADLVGFEGTLVSVEGYFRGGTLYARIAETEAVVTRAEGDTVTITVARVRLDKRELEVRGQVSAQRGSGAFAPSVAIDANCDGKLDATVAVIVDRVLAVGEFRYRSPRDAFTAPPSTVCVHSPLGGTSQRAVDIR